jgi:dTDP-4-amino-4,6-dideoxygalactose transaminase
MSEIHAAMGLCNIDKYEEIVSHNMIIYKHYRDKLHGVEGVSIIHYPEDEKNNFHYIIIEIDERKLGCSRDEIHSRMKANGIIARRYFFPGCHKSEPYKSLYPDVNLPNTDILCKRVLILPGGSAIDEPRQIDRVISFLY